MAGLEVITIQGRCSLTVEENGVGPYLRLSGPDIDLRLSPKQAIVLASEIRGLVHDATLVGLTIAAKAETT